MDDPLSESLRLIDRLNREGVEYIVIGGMAMNAHGLIRATEDLDLLVRPEDQNIDRLRRALKAVWTDPDIDQITSDDLCGPYPVIRYGPPEGTLYIDILARIGDVATYDDVEVSVVTLGGVQVRVASPQALFRLKRSTVRPIDAADANALQHAFDLEED